MSNNNFFGGGIGGTVTPRRRGGSIRWNGGLGAEHNASNASTVDASSFVAGIGYVGIAYFSVMAIANFVPKAKAKMNRITKKKGIVGVPEATLKGAQEIVKEVI